MEQPSPPVELNKSTRLGRVLGKELKGVCRLIAPKENVQSQVNDQPGAVGRKYEECTGRSAKSDGKVACMIGLTTAGVVGGVMIFAAASHVLVTGAILAVGVAGVAGCCKVTGHDEEYNTIVNASTTAVSTVVKSTRDFAGGVMEGVNSDSNITDSGPSRPVEQPESSIPNYTPGAPGGYVKVAATDAPLPLPPYLNVAQSGTTSLYPSVVAPAQSLAGTDLIDMNENAAPKER